MKAIAEYFRDLAADDRYFGAEPPQPDAEMLARIAQREVSRRVEARQQDGRIMLKAHEPTPAEVAAAAAPAAAQALAEAAAPEAAAEVPAAQPVAEAVAESPVQEEPVAAVTEPEAEAEIEIEEVAVAEDAAEAEEEIEEEAALPEAEEDVAGEDDADAFFATSEEVEEIAEDEAEEVLVAEPVAPAAAPQKSSIAAKLERIRAVVMRHNSEDDDPEYAEDEHAGEVAATAAPEAFALDALSERAETHAETLQSAASQIEEALDYDSLNDALAEDDSWEGDDDDALDGYDDDAVAAEVDADEDFEDEDDDSLTLAAIRGQIGDEARAPRYADEFEYADAKAGAGTNMFAADDAAEFDDEDEDEDAFEIDAAALSDAMDAGFDDEDDAPEAEVAAARVRILKVKRADLEAAVAAGDIEEYEDEADIAEASDSSLSDEEEAELSRELAEVEADLAGLDDEDEEDQDDDFAAAAAAARHDLRRAPATAEPDVSRLMAEAESQMEDPESADRRRAFAHLRAAVAAKKADTSLDADGEGEQTEGAYRSDLAEVVRPRRPVIGHQRSERRSEPRPAPLKLVAEQRIDIENAKPQGPVRPRRVAAVAETETIEAGETGFAEFAEKKGATNLQELLEAAASYMSFVEGREQFSRPQLMQRVRQIQREDFSREDSLRSFGQLLRSGKIEKIRGGRFTVSEQIGFKPDQRAAG